MIQLSLLFDRIYFYKNFCYFIMFRKRCGTYVNVFLLKSWKELKCSITKGDFWSKQDDKHTHVRMYAHYSDFKSCEDNDFCICESWF